MLLHAHVQIANRSTKCIGNVHLPICRPILGNMLL
jgi:hypothetical protein